LLHVCDNAAGRGRLRLRGGQHEWAKDKD